MFAVGAGSSPLAPSAARCRAVRPFRERTEFEWSASVLSADRSGGISVHLMRPQVMTGSLATRLDIDFGSDRRTRMIEIMNYFGAITSEIPAPAHHAEWHGAWYVSMGADETAAELAIGPLSVIETLTTAPCRHQPPPVEATDAATHAAVHLRNRAWRCLIWCARMAASHPSVSSVGRTEEIATNCDLFSTLAIARCPPTGLSRDGWSVLLQRPC